MTREIIAQLIKRLNLESHPEGGYYSEYLRSKDQVKTSDRFGVDTRSAATGIYFLLETKDFGAFHRIVSDETWVYHSGGTLSIYIIQPNGALTMHKLGDQVVHESASYTVTVPGGLWFAASVNEPDSYVFSSCYVSPAFEFKDFELADRHELIKICPQHKELIKRLTRDQSETIKWDSKDFR